jgi:CDP-6-deoxy-D-xylo-4-hexulose-3-dehydrase
MINIHVLKDLIKDNLPPYLLNHQPFKPGESTVWYSGPYWDEKEIMAGVDSLLNGNWITAGSKVNQFERKFGKKFNVKYSHMVNSGSSANLIMMAALKKRFNWQDGDEIIVSPVGFATTISVIDQNKLKPVFVDINWDTLNFDLRFIEDKITPKTRGIFISPVLGNPPNMDYLKVLSETYNIHLILDNCDSLGSKWEGKNLGEYAVAFSNSFYPAHHISTGEGGMVCTNDEELAKLIVSYSWWGRACWCVGAANTLPNGSCGCRFDTHLEGYDEIIDHKYVFDNMGYNVKPLDLQGAIGLIQLEKFDEIEANRKNSYNTIKKIFTENIEGVEGIDASYKADVSWFGTPFICGAKELKQKLVAHLELNKIQTRNYFAGNILLHPGYKHLGDYKDYPEANKVLDKVFFIGAAPHYTEETFKYIEKVVKSFKYE